MLRRAIFAAEETVVPCIRSVSVRVRSFSTNAHEEKSLLRKGHNPTGKFDHSHDRLAVEVDPIYDIAFIRKPFITTAGGNVLDIEDIPGLGVLGRVEHAKKTLRNADRS